MKVSLLISFLFFYFCSYSAALDTEWWKHTIVYEIIPYSYKDSDGDGIGDLRGIISKLDHLDDLKIETVHLTPIHKSEFLDIGYDITDFCSINPMYGTMSDFDDLIKEMNKRGMKLLMDLVINHSSDEHEWFQKSVDRIDPYTDFYVWKDSKGFDNETKSEIVPNKYVSVFGGTAWTWNEKRKQFYFHQFLPQQVDFNLYNEELKIELKKMIKFWLDRGVAGFRLDATPFYFEDKWFRDDDVHARQLNQPDTYAFIHELRLFVDEYNKQHGGIERILAPEAHTNEEFMAPYYGNETYPVAHFTYTFVLEHVNFDLSPLPFHLDINQTYSLIPKHSVALWMSQDHDSWRVGTRIRPEYSDIITLVSMMLPGSMGCYYGQEIAMLNGYILEENQIRDFSGSGSRDPARLLMQWDNSTNAGFSTNTTFVYVPPFSDFFQRNVESQKMQVISHYQMFKELSHLRQTDALKYGQLQLYLSEKNVYYAFSRSYKEETYIVVINFDSIILRVNLQESVTNLPPQLEVVTGSVNSGYMKGFELPQESLSSFLMRPLSCVVLKGGNTNVSE